MKQGPIYSHVLSPGAVSVLKDLLRFKGMVALSSGDIKMIPGKRYENRHLSYDVNRSLYHELIGLGDWIDANALLLYGIVELSQLGKTEVAKL